MPFGVKAVYECPDVNSRFRFDSIPAAKGVLGYFIDADGDGRPTPGRLLPWLAPEISEVLSDTVEAREGWDVEGIKVDGCDTCLQNGKK
jgi:hypothetical protein